MKTIKIFGFALMATFGVLLASCGSDDGGDSLPDIDGYSSADEVGEADLVAHWSLDGDGEESMSGAEPTASPNTTWVDGIKGKAASFNNGYMKYDAMTTFPSTMTGFTISGWVKVENNQTPTSGSVSTIFSMARPNEWEGNMNLYVETGQRPAMTDEGVANDSLVFKGSWRTSTDGGQAYDNILHLEPWMVSDNEVTPGKHVASPNVVGGTWAHAVFTWDGATHKFVVYSNGQKISNPAFEIRGENTSLTFDTPTFPMIGAFGNVATTADAWNKAMTGQVDEIRVWKRALTQAEIGSLYQLESVGR